MKNTIGMVLATILIGAGAQAAPDCGPDKAPASRYAVNTGEVHDLEKNITWARCVVGEDWVEGKGCVGAKKAPEASELAALIPPGWRLPNASEIATLLDICWSSGANREVFNNISVEMGLGFWFSDRGMNNGSPFAAFLSGGKVKIYVDQKRALARLVKG